MTGKKSALDLYNLPSGIPFCDALATGLLEKTENDPAALTRYRILLPTRRACRNLRDSFLYLTEGRPLLLPQLQPLGDIDEEELGFHLSGKETAQHILSLPPAISPLKRRLLLAELVMKTGRFAQGADQAIVLAGALGRLMDQVYTEGLDLQNLPALVDDEKLSVHWQVTIQFLEILSESWPEILRAHGVIDGADRRNRLLNILADYWEENPPEDPVIAAGSTGSIPATARLLKVVAGLPQGSVILPGLDREMDEKSWDALDDTHPQATLRHLLRGMEASREDVTLWPYQPTRKDESHGLSERLRTQRVWLAGEMMRPAATTKSWTSLSRSDAEKDALSRTLANVKTVTCKTAQEEANVIAVLLRETLEQPGRIAALITPDRRLARRVAMACRRWEIDIDDSGGDTLPEMPLGAFIRLSAKAALTQLQPGYFLALLKHKFCALDMDASVRISSIENLEIKILREEQPLPGFDGLRQKCKDDSLADFIKRIESVFKPFMNLLDSGTHDFNKFLDAHLQFIESLAAPENLWRGDAGESASVFFSELRAQIGSGASMPAVSGDEYFSILEQLMKTVSVRPAYGKHPRLLILGQLEARMMQADLVILSGLNEGVWPPDAATDPWMSRLMRKDFGLPSPERSIGLAAHDFVQGFCNSEVVLTRALRHEGAPTVPARWLQRLETVMDALGLDYKALAQTPHLNWARRLDRVDGTPVSITRPRPCPPVDKRPKELYVTAIEKWMRDPYSIYARYILKLRKLPDIEEQADAKVRGTIIHKVLEEFVRENPDQLPDSAYDDLIVTGREAFSEQLKQPRLWGFWWPRFERLAKWFVSHENIWRGQAKFIASEVKGSMRVDLPSGGTFVVSAKADRIDRFENGSIAIIDYKTGTLPKAKDVLNGFSPQLPLEGAIALCGGFENINGDEIGYLGFWNLTGGTKAGDERKIKTDDLTALCEQAETGLACMVEIFNNPETPYYSLPRLDKAPPAAWQDYAHLARVQEWAVLGDEDEEAA